jgi:hypothetical protein
MTYEEFLAQTDYEGVDITALDDQAATDVANAHTVTELVKINTDTRKTAIETVDIFNGTVDRLKAFTPSSALTTEQQEIASDLAPKIVKAFDKLMNTQFYINLNDPDVAMAFTAANTLDVLTQTEYDGIYKAAESITKPFLNKDMYDTQLVRDSGEVIDLPANHLQHAYQINTTNQPLKPTDIIIEHRFGTDAENLTDWIEIGRIRNVYYPTTMTNNPYKSGQVAASYANVRELRLVSPLTLGVVVA